MNLPILNDLVVTANKNGFFYLLQIQIPENSFRQKRSNAKDVTGKVRKGKNKSGRRRRAGKSRRKVISERCFYLSIL